MRHHQPLFANIYRLLGHYYVNQGELQPQIALTSDLYDYYNSIKGAGDTDTLTARSDLANAFRQNGNYQKAEELQLQVLALRRKVLGEKHPNTLTSMANLGATYTHLNHWDDANEIFEVALNLQQEVLGANHPATFISHRLICSFVILLRSNSSIGDEILNMRVVN